MPTISDKASRAIWEAVSRRGKTKGYVKAKAPRSNTLAYAAWMAHAAAFNPYKLSIFGLMCMDAEQREVYNELLAVFDWAKSEGFKGMDRDRIALENLGVW